MRLIAVFVGCLSILLTGGVDRAWAAQALNDEEMDQITAGSLSVSAENGQFDFQLGGDGGNRISVTGSGKIAATENSVPAGPAGYLILRDNAQNNIQAVVNVNAVNANVQVLINLIVNINSTVGTIHQINTVPSF